MAITSVIFFEVMRKTWGWPLHRAAPLLVLFLSFDVPFFAANLMKFLDGGYIPILVGGLFFVIMVDWRVGRQIYRELVDSRAMSIDAFLASLPGLSVIRVPGTAIYLSSAHGVPETLTMKARRLRSIMEHVVLLTVVIEHQPQVDEAHRIEVEPCAEGLVRVTIRFGYMENPNVPAVLEGAVRDGNLHVALADATYYVGRETFVGGKGGRMGPIVEGLFAFLSRNAKSAIDHFGLPLDQVVELGTRVDL
jgi:KUP system potassium uptake protein